jgi:hypothetical protein
MGIVKKILRKLLIQKLSDGGFLQRGRKARGWGVTPIVIIIGRVVKSRDCKVRDSNGRIRLRVVAERNLSRAINRNVLLARDW